jgi:PIN domain nuclease of toxin-antitoxin system
MIVLDTHAWIWFVDSPRNLGPHATSMIEKARHAGECLHIACISTWEIYMLCDKGRLSFAVAPDVWVNRCERLSHFRFHPLSNPIARLAVTACAAMHPDPADRMIAATALYLGASVVTCDEKIRAANTVTCVW